VKKILPEIIRELKAGGVKDSGIDIVMALGTHQAIPKNALVESVGKDVFRNHKVTQHDCFASDLVPVTTFASGIEVKINPVVAKADLAIGVGSILPHPMNGFGGGAKTLFPGVANYEAIREHHLRYTPERGAYIGNTQNNPFRAEVIRIARETNFRFVVNCIYNSKEEVVDIVAGDVHGAHQLGIKRSRELYGIDVPIESDVTVTSSFPYVSGPQIIKPLIPCSLLTTKLGGSVIMLASCKDGMPDIMLQTFDSLFEKGIGDRGRFAADTFKRGKLFVEGAIDFNCAIFYCLLCSARTKIVIVSEDLDKKMVERMGFQFEKSIQEALEKEKGKREGGTVNIFPIGGLFLPLSNRVPNVGA
jgi:nickel-dependent lactate racemase